MAFGYRAAALAQKELVTEVDDTSDTELQDGKPRSQKRCSIFTVLRFLQAMASVQAGPVTAVQSVSTRILEHLGNLKPQQCFYFLQALSRLRFRHPKAASVLERMSLVWRTLPEKQFIKAANAVAKLDLAENHWTKPLKIALVGSLPRLSGHSLCNLKSITVMELLNEPVSLTQYFEVCEQRRAEIWYSRHLLMVELYVHLIHPDTWAELSDHIRAFLQEVREAYESRQTLKDKSDGASRRTDDSDSDESSSEDEQESRDRAGKKYDKNRFTSPLHQDVSTILSDSLRIEHSNKVAAGPMSLDIFHMPTKTVIEVAPRWQFYLRSPRPTALVRKRHELLVAMGFSIVHIPFHKWEPLQNDEEKAEFLRSRLPPKVLALASTNRLTDQTDDKTEQSFAV